MIYPSTAVSEILSNLFQRVVTMILQENAMRAGSARGSILERISDQRTELGCIMGHSLPSSNIQTFGLQSRHSGGPATSEYLYRGPRRTKRVYIGASGANRRSEASGAEVVLRRNCWRCRWVRLEVVAA
jgi:hypothetical protein